MKLIKQLVFAISLGSFALGGSGCSAIGFGIGAVSDSSKIIRLGMPDEQATRLQENNHIQIFLKNGLRHDGKFITRMTGKIADENVASIVWYDEATDRQIATPTADIEQVVTINSQKDKWLALEEAATIRKNSDIKILLKSGQRHEGKFLIYWEEKVGDEHIGNIEWYDKATNQKVSTQTSEIKRIIAKQQRYGKWVGIGIGSVLDTIIVVGVINAVGKSLDGFDFSF